MHQVLHLRLTVPQHLAVFLLRQVCLWCYIEVASTLHCKISQVPSD